MCMYVNSRTTAFLSYCVLVHALAQVTMIVYSINGMCVCVHMGQIYQLTFYCALKCFSNLHWLLSVRCLHLFTVYIVCYFIKGFASINIALHLSCFYRDTAGQERFRTITTAYYRGAMVSLSLYCMPSHVYVHVCMYLCLFGTSNYMLHSVFDCAIVIIIILTDQLI